MAIEHSTHPELLVCFAPGPAKIFLEYVRSHNDTFPDDPISLDFETTSLYPWEGRVRLTSITAGSLTGVIDHDLCGSFEDMYEDIVKAADVYYVFNAKFELAWFDFIKEQIGSDLDATVHDIAFLRKSVLGGGPLSLKLMAKWDLGYEMDKDQQTSDWSAKTISDEQYHYAGFDAFVTRDLALYWKEQMKPNHWKGFMVLNSAVRATIEAEQTGLVLDMEYHNKLIRMWKRRRDAAEACIRKYTPENVWPNLRSKKQLSDLIKSFGSKDLVEVWPKTAKTGQLDTSRAVLNQFSYRTGYPVSRWLAAIMVFNRADKYLNTYGEKLLNSQRLSGRIFANFNMAQAITGRYSSSGACNLQNLPNNPKVRRSFIAPRDRKLVIADYKSIELRVLAEMSEDEQLMNDVIYGDSHAQSAIAIYHFDEKKFKEALENHEPWAVTARRKAKAFSFLIVYGGGPGAVAVSLRCSDDEASEFIRRWAHKYPKAYHFRNRMLEQMNIDGHLPCKSGRTIYVPRQDRSTTVASNYPIQGTAADVMYRAMYRAHNAIIKEDLMAWIAATVHDEVLLEVEKGDAKKAQEVLEQAMMQGWLDIFPGTSTHRLIESAIGDHWGAKA